MPSVGRSGGPGVFGRARVVRPDPERQGSPDDLVARGETGELIVSLASPEAFAGYWRRPDADARALRGGWYFTGDLVYEDAEGDVYTVGRVDDMIISGGENIYPIEVEDVLLKHPDVAEACVVGLPDERLGQVVAAFVVPRMATLRPDDLDAFCRAAPGFAVFKRPRRYEFVDALPSSTRYGSPGFLLKQFFRGAAHAPDVAVQIMMGGLALSEQHQLVSPSVREACAAFDPYRDIAEIMTGAPTTDPISRLVYHHCKLYLAGQTLVKMYRGTMAYGVEARAPFLDPDLVTLACAMPSAMKLRGWTTKYALKLALVGRVPHEILTRRKQGFGVPMAQWLRGPLRSLLEQTLDPARVGRVGLLDAEHVSGLVAEHGAGHRDHRKLLWNLLVFELWREAYLPGVTWR